MRKLTQGQKKVLNTAMKENKDISCWNDLSEETRDTLNMINCTEILLQEVDRYISDKRMKEVYL